MIQINNKLRIVKIDGLNLQLEELRKVVGKKTGEEREEWCWVGYYGDLKSALLGALSKHLFNSVDEELLLKDVVAKIEEARVQIVKAIENIGGQNGN